ncbi:laminin subunit gamma-1 [Ceratitis capitata]|nr:laminin subunit gamma-1 [Ceratitis capitata]XP_012161098.1 laminin subunit gamma-1 [Ceratitis capitata]XP_012161099.1 laminin subunit gamma-1 [Ceratitis capitata]XP_012161100.1 laminin subunit gamma-1 [Ceratitis capitata]XP_012161102.1 laminin subunit gamma-1 [Ceratitis capitata]XP_012161103.1 laminin subunit gamma-1 [Ceratitis capitata]
MAYKWLIYLAYFMVTPSLLPAISYQKRNYDFRYANSDVPQWKQRACQKTQREKMNLHYICDEKGNVKCLPGWQGDLCQVPQCRKGCDPMNGYCQRPDECRCRIGYTGEFCERCIPLPGCQHGYCNKPFECICKPGWDGLFCTEPTCRAGCHNTRGYCEAPGECRCRLGWAGRSCSDCAVLPGCQHGTCQKPLECNCLPGYTGLLCQTAICATGCHKQRGYCTKPGECRCKVGWTGENCGQCFPYPGCVNGDCERPWECNCKPGWGGMLCDEKLTYCAEHPNTCENGGRCISYTKEDGSYRCECKQGYLGKNCEILDEFILTSTTAPRITPPPMPQWGDDMENETTNNDAGERVIDAEKQLENEVAQNNTTTTTTKPALLHNSLIREALPTETTGELINDTKSLDAHNSNATKPTNATHLSIVPTQLPEVSNATVVSVKQNSAGAIEATATAAKTHLNLINVSANALKSPQPTAATQPSRSADESGNSTSSTASPATVASSPIPIPLHFFDASSLANKKISHTLASVNSNLAAHSGNKVANEVANRDEYDEDTDDDEEADEVDEEGDDEDEDDDDDDDDETEDDEEDEDDLIPDVLNSVA